MVDISEHGPMENFWKLIQFNFCINYELNDHYEKMTFKRKTKLNHRSMKFNISCGDLLWYAFNTLDQTAPI